MTRKKESKQAHATNYYYDPNHDYFSGHFEELVQSHGGKWIVLAKGRLVAICDGSELDHWLDEAEKNSPKKYLSPHRFLARMISNAFSSGALHVIPPHDGLPPCP